MNFNGSGELTAFGRFWIWIRNALFMFVLLCIGISHCSGKPFLVETTLTHRSPQGTYDQAVQKLPDNFEKEFKQAESKKVDMFIKEYNGDAPIQRKTDFSEENRKSLQEADEYVNNLFYGNKSGNDTVVGKGKSSSEQNYKDNESSNYSNQQNSVENNPSVIDKEHAL